MPVKIKSKKNNLKFLDGIGEDLAQYDTEAIKTGLHQLLIEYGVEFQKVINKWLIAKNVNASGALSKNIEAEVSETSLEILMPSYFDFPNKGVKGVKSSAKAPQSQYKFKNFGMSIEGRASLRKYIQSGKNKISAVKKYKKIGVETKSRPSQLTIDQQVEQFVFAIKHSGLKATHYLDKALEEVMKDLGKNIAEVTSQEIIIEITR